MHVRMNFSKSGRTTRVGPGTEVGLGPGENPDTRGFLGGLF